MRNRHHKEIPLNPVARDLFAREADGFSRILVLGGAGWFGRTALAMLGQMANEVLVIGSYERTIDIGSLEIPIRAWDQRFIAAYKPDLVLDFAFLTRDFEQTLGTKKFRAVNDVLSERLRGLAHMASVQRILTVSSGAAVVPKGGSAASPLDSYGQQKLALEASLSDAAALTGTEVAIARAWSVSGGHVQKYQNYAFSEFIHSAVNHGFVRLRAKSLVTRRYCAVEDFLAVVMANSQGRSWVEVDSGGEVVELGDLASLVAEEVGADSVSVVSNPRDVSLSDSYHSDNASWLRACSSARFEPLTLLEQIHNVREAFS